VTPLDRIIQATRPVVAREALQLVSGKTEKPGGVDPALLLAAGLGNGRRYFLGHVPLDLFRANDEGERYDGTVDIALARDYAARSPQGAPPVIAVLARDGSRLNIHDGGHRISAARIRGDQTLFALVSMRARDLPGSADPLLASPPASHSL
jgi:hypothetical protein